MFFKKNYLVLYFYLTLIYSSGDSSQPKQLALYKTIQCFFLMVLNSVWIDCLICLFSTHFLLWNLRNCIWYRALEADFFHTCSGQQVRLLKKFPTWPFSGGPEISFLTHTQVENSFHSHLTKILVQKNIELGKQLKHESTLKISIFCHV